MERIKTEDTPVCHPQLPPWLKRKTRENECITALKKNLRKKQLNTICQSAGCPNTAECFQKSTATFLILGNVCTRRCLFCGVEKGLPLPVDQNEPQRIAEAVQNLGLKHVVMTSVTRDDLEDGGASHFAETVRTIHLYSPCSTVEVLIPDFKGSLSSLKTVLESGVDVLNHNMETVSRLYAKIRPEASFSRSLEIFRSTKQYFPKVITKSGVMLGLGETTDEVCWVFERLLESGCDALTLGQYLMPSRTSYPVHEYVRPEQFEVYRKIALRLGFRWVKAGPYVRSSFHADELVAQCEGVMV